MQLYCRLTRLERSDKLAFASSLLFGLFAHLYKMVNYLPGNDSLLYHYHDENVLASGRWLLSLACGFSSYYDLPWLIGILSLMLIGIGAVMIAHILHVNSPVLAILVGGLMATFPAVTYTFFFGYTVDGYMVAMVLSVLAVYFSRMGDHTVSHYALSALCVCMACGIYQAYISFGMVLALCYFILELLDNNWDDAEYKHFAIKQIAIYAVGLAAYYGIWKLCMLVQNTVPTSYQGIDQVGSVSLSLILNGVVRSIKSCILFFFEWNVSSHGWSMYSLLNAMFLLSLALVMGISLLKSRALKDYRGILTLISLAACVFAAFIWYFASDGVAYRPIMLYSMCPIYILLAILAQRWIRPRLRDFVWVLLLAIIFNNSVQANISYSLLHDCYETTYAEAMEMILQIRELQSEETEQIAIIGERIHEVEWLDGSEQSNRIRTVAQGLQKSLMFDRWRTYNFFVQVFHLDMDSTEGDQLEELSRMDEVSAMPCWPENGSVGVVDGIVVLKLGEIE